MCVHTSSIANTGHKQLMLSLAFPLATNVNTLVDESVQYCDDDNSNDVDDVQDRLDYAREVTDLAL